ncbi:hypothetical protein EOM81_11355 [bacterium]|nr:hypothetical protein [bacterium]
MINEIELGNGRLSVQCFDFEGSAKEAIENSEKFNLESESPGLHDYDFSDETARGFYSIVEPFEVESLVDGIMSAKLEKRIVTAEFIILPPFMFTWGNSGCIKLLKSYLGNGFATVNSIEFDFENLYNLQNRFSLCKTVKIKNPKEMSVRNATLQGNLEAYTEYNVTKPNNHELKTVSGILEMPIGPATVTATSKGALRLITKKGMIFDANLLVWLVRLIHNAEI